MPAVEPVTNAVFPFSLRSIASPEESGPGLMLSIEQMVRVLQFLVELRNNGVTHDRTVAVEVFVHWLPGGIALATKYHAAIPGLLEEASRDHAEVRGPGKPNQPAVFE
jgi:hypothetical protein